MKEEHKYKIIEFVRNYPTGLAMNISEVARNVGLTKQTTSKYLASMVSNELVPYVRSQKLGGNLILIRR